MAGRGLLDLVNAQSNSVASTAGSNALSDAAYYASQGNNEDYNRGGLLGGLGYLGEKLGVGFVSSIEGIWDYAAGGIARLIGEFGSDKANKWAEQQIATDWFGDWYSHPDEWYNPSKGWQIAGDVAGGIGTSLPGMVASVGVSIVSGGALAPFAAGIVAGATGGLAAAGRATKEAYQKTGQLGGKEFAYGALTGATEGLMESISGAIGTGTGAAVKAISNKFAKETVQTVARQSVVKTLAKGFIGEAFEEGMSEILAPVYQRMTFDPDAEAASLSEVSYAALVGGLSGLVMGGGTAAVTTAANIASGTRINQTGQTAEVMGLADAIAEFEVQNDTGDDAFRYVKETRDKLAESLQKTNGAVETVQQRALLGDLSRANIAAVYEPMFLRSAATTLQNADVIAKRLTAYGYKDASGNPITVTAEDIRKGYDPADPKSIPSALKSNNILRTLAVSDAVGRLSMDAKAFESASLAGQDIASMDDINRYLETVPEKQVRAFGEKIGVADMYSVDAAEFNQKVRAFAQSGGLDTSARDAIVSAAEAVPREKARSMPKMINLRNDGTVRYADADSDIAITKKGDAFYIYDYDSGLTTNQMTRAEVNRALRQYQGKRTAVTELIKTANAQTATRDINAAETAKNEAVEAKTETAAEATEGPTAYSKAAAELDAKARAEVKGYNTLSEPNKAMIRRVLRDAKRAGLSDADATLYASVSAKSGLDISFNKEACAVKGKDGNTVYANGYYDAGGNRIVVNPDAQNKGEAVLIHELDHALRTDMRGFSRVYKQAVKGLTEEQRTEIADRYSQFDAADLLDEYNAHFAEYTLTDKNILRRLVEDKPTIGERILAFFTGASADYDGAPALQGAAKRYYKQYKKMFDNFSARNQGNNAYAGAAQGQTKQMSFSSIAYTFFGDEKMSADDFEKGNYKQKQGYKDYVEKSVGVMLQSHKGMTEKAARAEIESSIDGIVRVALAAKRAGYDIIDRAAERSAKDSRKRLLFSSLEPNSDYFTSHDVSTICDKRKNFAQIYDDIVSREEQLGVPQGQRFFDNVDNYFYIHKVLADKGLTQPCRECYVESMRKNLAPMASAFLRLVQETDTNNTANDQLYHQEGKDKGKAKSNNTALRKYILKALDEYGMTASELNAERLTTAEGLAEIKITAPKIYEGFNSFYGQSKPKLPREATPFRFGELTALLTKNDGTINQNLVNRINKTGGFRLQSYSDFQVQNYVDVLQVLFEAGTLGLSGHAYTKVPAFLDATANTNLKRNISIFMYKDGGKWFVDRNDSFPGSLEDISAIVDADATGNTGIIAVSQNADMSAYIMADDRIGYGIPFHKSGIKMDVVRSTEVKTEDGRTVLGYQDIKDHTRQQSEVNAATEKKVKKPIDIYSFWDFDNKDGLTREELIKKNVTAYLDACEKKGYLPKFREYVIDNDGVLDDVLHYAKEIGSVAENSTVDDISFEYRAQDGSVKYRVPYGYYKFLGDFSMFAPDGSAVPIQPLSLANYDFKAAEDFFSDAETVRRNELLQQFANGEERKRYRESGMTAEQLQDVIAAKRGEVVNEIVGKKKYSLPNNDKLDNFPTKDYTYTQEQYEKFGWAREVGGITANEMDDLEAKAQIKKSLADYPSSKAGENIIAVNNDPKAKLAVNNVLAFVTGSKKRYKITRTARFAANTEMEMEDFAYGLFENNVFDDEAFSEIKAIGVASEYTRRSAPSFAEYLKSRRKGSKDANSRENGDLDRAGDERSGATQGSENAGGVKKQFSLPKSEGVSGADFKDEIAAYNNSVADAAAAAADTITTGTRVIAKDRGNVGTVMGYNSETGQYDVLFKAKDGASRTVQMSADMIELAPKKKSSAKKKTEKAGSDIYGKSAWEPVAEGMYLSKGALAKLRADYRGDKTFSRKDVQSALSGVEVLKGLPAETKKSIEEVLWAGYNNSLNQEGFDAFTEAVWHRLHAMVLQDGQFDMTEAEVAAMDAQIVEALQKIVSSGKESTKARIERENSDKEWVRKATYWKNEHRNVVNRNRNLDRVKYEVERLANAKMGRYVNASHYRGNSFRVAINELAKMNWRGGLVRDAKIREHFAALDAWYTKENPLYKGDGNGNELFKQDIKDALSSLGNAKNGALSNDDLMAAETVLQYFSHEIEAHNTVYKNEKRLDAKPIAKDFVEKIDEAAEVSGRGLFTRSSFAKLTADPALLMRQADGYLHGFFTVQYGELRQGAIDAAVKERELSAEFEQFFEQHKSYGKRYNNETVTYDGKEMPLQEAMSLYMTMKREHAFSGLAAAGFEIDGKRATENISDGFLDRVEELKSAAYKELAPEELLTLTKDGHANIEKAALEKAVSEKRDELFRQFSDEDKVLIDIMERGMEAAREVKVKIDNIVQGYSNVTGGYYYPIKRTGLVENVDSYTGFEGDRVSNLSINKDTVKNAHKLLIEPAHVVYMRHMKAISLYHGLGVFTDNFNRLYNLNIKDGGSPLTIRDALGRSNSYTKDMMAYLKELKQDVEGISKKRNSEKFYNDAVAYIRSAYATYQLGANPKVWFTQLSSFIAATNMLDADVIARSATVSGKDVDKYCRLAWLRDNDNAAAMAQAVSTPKNAAQRAGRSALQKVRDGSTALIGKMDRLVVRKLFAACQVQVEKNGGAKVGTEENKVAAGKLLQSVILETQQNSLTTERSAAMRSGDELLKGSTMFSADAMKITARAVEAEGEARAMRYYIKKAKEAGQDAKVEELTKKLKAANKKRGRALMAIVGVALFNAALAYGFKKLYRKDDEESAATFAADTFGNMLGGIPFVRDAWGLIYDGYDVDHFLYSTFNDVLATVPASYKLLQAAANGEEVTRQQVLAHMRKVLYTTGQLTGVPVRNVYNVSTGLINRFSPETGYKIDSLIYEKNYQSDLKKALEKGDEDMAAFLIGMLLGGNASDAVGNELLSLIASGYSVLPREVPDSYTYNGESVALTKAQQARASTYYGGVSQTLEALFGSAGYQGLSAEKRAAAVESVYDEYRSEAISEATGVDIRSKREIIAKAVGTETMALMQAITSGITADKDKNGNTIDGSKRKKVVSAINAMQVSPQQKLLLIAASGYRVQEGDVRGVKGDAQRVLAAYILKQSGLSSTERTQLLKACGFNVVNGKVVLK